MKTAFWDRLPVLQHKEVKRMEQNMNKANNPKKNANQNEQNQQDQQNNKPGSSQTR